MDFFQEQKKTSYIKSEIVKKYFWAWAKIIGVRSAKIAYIDLYAGPGIYDDGNKSTPLLVLENALRDSMMMQKLVTIFNDTNPDFVTSLKKAISEIPDIKTLTNQPIVTNFTIGSEIVNQLKSMKLIPSLLFLDPWGYKGLSLDLISSVLKDWGCDCIFFFNYVRINAGLNNDKFKCHIDAIFSHQRANELRECIKRNRPYKREELVLACIKDALSEIGGHYVISFKFIKEKINRTSHFLIFVSKNVLGYTIMKEIMAEMSSHKYQNVATFEYNTRHKDYGFFPPTPLNDLENELLGIFKGKTLTVKDIFQNHNIDTPYILANYKEALLNLEEKKQINANPPVDKRPHRYGKPTMSDKVIITFKD